MNDFRKMMFWGLMGQCIPFWIAIAVLDIKVDLLNPKYIGLALIIAGANLVGVLSGLFRRDDDA